MSEALGAASSEPAAPVPLRHNRGFRFLWIGQVVSDTGTEAAYIAYPLLVLALTRSAVIAGIVGTVQLTVELVLGLPGGAISDRLDRRLTMIACDTVRACVLAALAALVLLHEVTWPVVLTVAVIDGSANVLFNPAATAALPAIVADRQLEQAWAATEARTYTASLAGPALGGVLFGLGSAVASGSPARGPSPGVAQFPLCRPALRGAPRHGTGCGGTKRFTTDAATRGRRRVTGRRPDSPSHAQTRHRTDVRRTPTDERCAGAHPRSERKSSRSSVL